MHTFAIYRLPFAKECTMLIQHSAPLVLSSLAELEGKKGFVMSTIQCVRQMPHIAFTAQRSAYNAHKASAI